VTPDSAAPAPSLDILWLATKCPWPPRDGGRLVAANTLEALAGAGHRPTVLYPWRYRSREPKPEKAPPGIELIEVPCARHSALYSAFVAWRRQQPWTLVHHATPEVAAEARKQLAGGRFDVVHAEQVQAFAGAEPALEARVPVVLRAQNVEAELWEELGRRSPYFKSLIATESRRLSLAEGHAAARAQATIGLTARDVDRLSELSGRTIVEIPAPAAQDLPAGPELPGGQPLALLGSGWPPSREGAFAFLKSVWPALAAAEPDVRLHVFGLRQRELPLGVVAHAAPDDSAAAFPANGILLVPLNIASGVRMKILEAWARGVPVIASTVALRGLRCAPGTDLHVADDVDGYRQALRRLRDPEHRAAIVAAGRATLARHHQPADIAARLGELYARLAARGRIF
jgi:hypothetical protein